ncbi:helix-turn-helix transcriptional regulator [Variovorax sp. Sphag1AA]|uniref:helix-turn-helix domain-containing protein n=1 Tax=Variovorax sp. Sphag1AA TaxID=2587027 RepID=UPI00160D052D|nr:hypothetical protein [Variovorax sp. Sphag1AA]MBB3181164.1 hypothetical protein [Variovorax sp. Sphag1AA]
MSTRCWPVFCTFATREAEDISAPEGNYEGNTDKVDERNGSPKKRPDDSHGAKLLLAALASKAQTRGHSPNELAAAIGIHPAHWYRLRAHPAALARCDRETLQSIANYLEWPLGRVLLASAAIDIEDFEIVLGGTEVIHAAIAQIEEGAYGSGLVNPLSSASRDHQLLIAELYFELQARTANVSKTSGWRD